ncbi:response regulator transcription factor [Kinneretia aquatilis]|uniref:response regulator transcription factor n=1 Tax=Kinneretia aquatilis TaxID=2070761 RepID=UPI001495108F|nr:response regulator transcription factor [Paucibacter aquatile]WIW00039.1 response regulator transcription factor [Paucibacter aquatile]
MRVLIVEDSAALATTLGDYLGLLDCSVSHAHSAASALASLRSHCFDVLLLDINMAGMDGLSLCRSLRQDLQIDTPVLFLTARDTLPDKLAGFAAGGDDYLVKPFALEELGCRVRALHARHIGAHKRVLRCGALELDLVGLILKHQDRPIALDPVQLKIVRLLMQKAPAVVSKADLEYAIWQDEAIEGSALRTHVYRLRQLLPPGCLSTVRGQGYRLDASA